MITWAMRNAFQVQDLARWDKWISSPVPSLAKSKVVRQDSTASRPNEGVSRTNSNTSLLAKEQEKSAFAKSAGKDTGKLVRTATASSAPSVMQKYGEVQPKASPARVATDIVEDDPDDAPAKPTWFVGCDGCYGQWTVMDEPLFNCADCVGNIQLDRQCYDLLKDDQLDMKGLKCRKEHKFLEIPAWDGERFKDMPRGCLPLPAQLNQGKRWIPLEEWKERLRQLYLPE